MAEVIFFLQLGRKEADISHADGVAASNAEKNFSCGAWRVEGKILRLDVDVCRGIQAINDQLNQTLERLHLTSDRTEHVAFQRRMLRGTPLLEKNRSGFEKMGVRCTRI